MKRSCTQIATAAATLCIGNSKHMDHIIFASLHTHKTKRRYFSGKSFKGYTYFKKHKECKICDRFRGVNFPHFFDSC